MIPVIRTMVENGTPVEMTVTGNSMLPLLKNRISSVRLIKPDGLEKGDIVLYRRKDGHYVLHRIVALHDGVYDVSGDNQQAVDKNVLRADIFAKVNAYSRDGRCWKERDNLYRLMLPAVKTLRRVKRRLGAVMKRK